ncbi:hypothetical protein MBLNU13_g05445t1 [Cladosporium sp. NU13]
MPTTMLLRRNAASAVKRIASQEPLLPFLYNTRTIRTQHTDALSELENSPNDQGTKPQSHDGDGGTGTGPRIRINRGEYLERARKSQSKRMRREHSDEEESLDGLLGNSGHSSRRPAREEHIPFEHAAQETMSIRDRISTSTMTPMEKKAFENLLSLSPQKAPKDKGRHRDRVDDVLNQAKRSREKQAARDETPMPQMLKAMQDKMKDDRSAAQKVLLDQAVELDLQQVKKALETAETDIEMWKILHEAVLSRVTRLRLEEPAPAHKQRNRKPRAEKEDKQKSPWPGNVSDELVIKRTLPQHLVECQRQLSSTFPSSQLHLSLLPYIKTLGPTTYALATSTKLYNQHMRSLFRSQSNLPQIVHTLEEMDKEVYEYDDKTKDLMDLIKKRGSQARSGVYGAGNLAIWNGERFRKTTRAITYWSRSIEERMQDQALRDAKLKEGDVGI